MPRSRLPMSAVLLTLLILLPAAPARAWHREGHEAASRLALRTLPDEVPAFLRQADQAIRHYVLDPDLLKLKATPQLRDAEHPEHYIDLELLQGKELPPTRSRYIALCAELEVAPRIVGTLPYALTEWTQRLTIALAEHRQWPDDPLIQAKALYCAGVVAHYAQDLAQPLHTTIHFDGRVGPDGVLPHSGIHHRVDGLFAAMDLDFDQLAAQIEPQPYDDLFGDVVAELMRSHALVDHVYVLEDQLPSVGEGEHAKPEQMTEAVERFALDRLKHAARITASLYLTAWQDAQTLELPEHLGRTPAAVMEP